MSGSPETLPNEEGDIITSQTILWQGILLPGHEACRLFSLGSHWHLEGMAVFSHEQKPCQLNYLVVCDALWHTLSASIEGWLGNKFVNIKLSTDTNQHWWMNDVEISEVKGCIDFDLNFSPSTNTIPIRRLNLRVGEKVDITVAWLKFPGFTLEPLAQRYQRLEEGLYRYESGGGRYVADLRVNRSGFVIDYPGIWKAEASSDW